MRRTALRIAVPAAIAVCVALGAISAVYARTLADWELWPDKTTMPPGEQLGFLPVVATGESISYTFIDLGNQTLEKDGQTYKAIQWVKDATFVAEAETGKYLLGLVGQFYPTGTVDVLAMMSTIHLSSVEIDGTVVPIDSSYRLRVDDTPFTGQTAGIYNVFPRFNTPGTHTYREIWSQDQPFFYVEPVAAEALCVECEYPPDPFPEFEGRYVYVPEQIGDPVDGRFTISYTLNVVEAATNVEPSAWGRIKSTFR